MNTAWFDVTVAWLPGTLLGLAGGAFGALVGFARMSGERRKRWLSTLQASYWTIVSLSAVSLVLAIVAMIGRQPRAVWYSLLMPGILGTCLFGSLAFSAVRSLANAKEDA